MFQTVSTNQFIKGEFMRKGLQKCQTGTDTRGKGNAEPRIENMLLLLLLLNQSQISRFTDKFA